MNRTSASQPAIVLGDLFCFQRHYSTVWLLYSVLGLPLKVVFLLMDDGDVYICQNKRKEKSEKVISAFLNEIHLICEIKSNQIKSKHACVIIIYLSENEG